MSKAMSLIARRRILRLIAEAYTPKLNLYTVYVHPSALTNGSISHETPYKLLLRHCDTEFNRQPQTQKPQNQVSYNPYISPSNPKQSPPKKKIAFEDLNLKV